MPKRLSAQTGQLEVGGDHHTETVIRRNQIPKRVLIEGAHRAAGCRVPIPIRKIKEGLICNPTFYLYLSSGWAGRSLVFLEGAGAGLFWEQYCWHGPRVAGMSWRGRCRRRPGVAGRGAAVA